MFLAKCSSSSEHYSTENLAKALKSDAGFASTCSGSDCCLESRDCTRLCRQIFYKSSEKVHKTCDRLPKKVVNNLSQLVEILKTPVASELRYLEITDDFRLLLVLDHQVFIRVIQEYNVENAKEFAIWLTENSEPTEELQTVEKDIRNEILFEMFHSVGGRTLPDPLEEALVRKITFDASYFQLLVRHSNDDLLQMTHEMFKEKLCSVEQTGSGEVDLCVLRVYCKEGESLEYVHSEDLRNKIAGSIKDENFFKYIEEDILLAGLGVPMLEPNMNNSVCGLVCRGGLKSCE